MAKDKDSDLSQEDKDLWQEFAKSVKPLEKTEGTVKKNIPTARPRKERTPKQQQAKLAPPPAETIKRLTSQKIDGKIDLHHATKEAAYDRLDRFIESSYHQGRRCVLVVTGKGNKREDSPWWQEVGLLREKVPKWLETPHFRVWVSSYGIAKPEHGGSGALYVFLKKKKE